jgi:hypothetical protein
VKRWILVLVLLAACRPSADTSLGTAQRFVDEHYVRMDLRESKKYCVGVAREKVEELQRLIGDQRIDASTRQPRVSYSLERKKEEGGDRASYLFLGRIHVEDADDFERHWLVMTRRQKDGKWRVSNFQEIN